MKIDSYGGLTHRNPWNSYTEQFFGSVCVCAILLILHRLGYAIRCNHCKYYWFNLCYTASRGKKLTKVHYPISPYARTRTHAHPSEFSVSCFDTWKLDQSWPGDQIPLSHRGWAFRGFAQAACHRGQHDTWHQASPSYPSKAAGALEVHEAVRLGSPSWMDWVQSSALRALFFVLQKWEKLQCRWTWPYWFQSLDVLGSSLSLEELHSTPRFYEWHGMEDGCCEG